MNAAAQAWDGAFAERTAPHRNALRAHCYRMLGSSHDTDDLMQETLLRAWRGRGTLRDEGRLRSWLLRIATHACLDELRRRPRRVVSHELGPPAEPSAGVGPAVDEPWLEPAPDGWIDALDERSAGARFSQREAIALGFVAALQVLSPIQRAVLLLRDVVGLSAEETAAALDTGVGAANSALFRARARVEERLRGTDPAALAPAAASLDAARVARYVRAYEENDLEALVGLLRDDVRTAMPPSRTWIAGRAANEAFYGAMFGAVPRGAVRLLPTFANGAQAFGFYRGARDEPRPLRAIHVIGVREGRIATIDHFMMPELAALFGLPAVA